MTSLQRFLTVLLVLLFCLLMLARFMSTTPTRGIWEEGVSVDMVSPPDWTVERLVSCLMTDVGESSSLWAVSPLGLWS